MTNNGLGAAFKYVGDVVSLTVDSEELTGATGKIVQPPMLNSGPKPRGPFLPNAQGYTTKNGTSSGTLYL